MFYFREKKYNVNFKGDVEKLLNQSTSRVSSMFDLTSTSSYIIHEERPLVGQKLNTNEVLISRYRHAFLKIVPRIVSKWKLEVINGEKMLIVKNRLGLYSTLALFFILFPLVVTIVKSIINFEIPDFEILIYTLLFLGLFYSLATYEIRKTDGVILKIINSEKTKSIVTI